MHINHRDAITVVGLAARTTNAREMTAEGAISKLWGRIMRAGMLASIPNRAGSEIIALYTEYESDQDGQYTFVVGARVHAIGEVPGGMVAKKAAAGEYAVFRTEANPAKDAVVALWQEIWSLENSHRLTRAYNTDYEVHHFTERGETAAEIYVGVKK